MLIVVSACVAVAALLGVLFVVNSSDPSKKTAGSPKEPPRTIPAGTDLAVPSITDKAVLTIVGTNRTGTPEKQGSGFILTADGLAGSNYHVLKGVSHAVAGCCDGRVFEIRSIEGVDLDKDLVVFQIYEKGSQYKPHDLPHVILGTSRDSNVGERIITIGSPEGLENTMSDGILSAIREYDAVRLLQITAPISPGSSGGPVFDAAGKVIGVTTFQFTKGQNLNFAVAAEHIQPLLKQNLGVPLSGFQSFADQTQRDQARVATSHTTEALPEKNQSAGRPLTGEFAGVVHNLPANVSAGFVILVNETDGVVSGCMGVKQPLFGSGPLSGFVDGADVSFAVVSAIGKITFTGRRKQAEITGTYIVEHQGSPNEDGTFTLRRIKSEGLGPNPNTAGCPTDAEMNQ
jgi:S1-C subfamily serine protease